MKTIFFPGQTPHDGRFAATIGFFDGVHKGHRYLVEHLRKEACRRGLKSMVITFERHPRQVVQPQWVPELLTTLDEKIRLLSNLDIDVLTVLRFDEQMAALSAREFMEVVLKRQLNTDLLLTGYDNRFGHDRMDGFDAYQRYGHELGMEVICGEALSVGDDSVSSSRIRQLLRDGEVDEAHRCLGRPYVLGGQVVHGEQIGRKIGFPTANLQPDDYKLIPKDGVYAVLTDVEGYSGQKRGITNIGSRPTFNGTVRTLETNLLDEVGQIYDKRLNISFFQRLRDEQFFPSGSALAEQIRRDKEEAEYIFERL